MVEFNNKKENKLHSYYKPLECNKCVNFIYEDTNPLFSNIILVGKCKLELQPTEKKCIAFASNN